MIFKKIIGSRAEVWHGTAKKTSGGLLKKDLKMNKRGRIVSKKMSNRAKKDKRLEKAGYKTKKGKFTLFKSKNKRGGSQIVYIAIFDQLDNTYRVFISVPEEDFHSAYNMLMNNPNHTAEILDLRGYRNSEHEYNMVLRKIYNWDRIVLLENYNRENGLVNWRFLSDDKNELEDFLKNNIGANHIIMLNTL